MPVLRAPGTPELDALIVSTAGLLRSLPLRACPPGVQIVASAEERGWLAGIDDCRSLLRETFGDLVADGVAFGCSWPYVRAGGRVVAPAVPVAAADDEASGPDGAYRLSADHVEREAGGTVRTLIDLGSASATDEPSFDLLWFGELERYLLRGSRLQVEDLFSRLEMSVDRPALETLLIRGRRCDQRLIAGLPAADGERTPEPASIEVRRPLSLMADCRWNDPSTFLRARAGVDAVRHESHEPQVICIVYSDRREQLMKIESTRGGWQAEVLASTGAEEWPIQLIEARQDETDLVYRVILDRAVNPLAPGLRGRLAFDLSSDLVQLTR